LLKSCPFCGFEKLYILADKKLKCAKCKKKISPSKIERENRIIECFCKNLTPLECSKTANLHYVTVKKRYDEFRKTIAIYMEKEYQNRESITAYEEYIYLENSKRKDKKYIFDAYNFLTFEFDNKIYNLMMPDLSRYKLAFLKDELESLYYKEFEKFLRTSKVSGSSSARIERFWLYFEEFIKKFRGIKRENFFYYLKEAEFRFNFDCEKLKEIL